MKENQHSSIEQYSTPATDKEADFYMENNIQMDFFDRMRKTQTDPKIESVSLVESDASIISQADEFPALTQEEREFTDNAENSHSGMPHEARRALVSLLRHGAILYAQKARLFETLCRFQVDIRKHLSEVYLKLVLDEKAGVAFVATIQNEEDTESNDDTDDAVSLINRRTLPLYDTLLLLVLRKHYQEREAIGEQTIVIDIERIKSNLIPFLPLTNHSKSDRRKLEPALNKMQEKKILRKLSGSKERYEITPVIRYVVNVEFLESMRNEYLKIANEIGVELNKSGMEANDMIGEDNG